MELKEAIRSALEELILPDINKIIEDNNEIKTILGLTNKRLDDINLHLADQSRRIDDLRKELRDEISNTNVRIDDLRVELRDELAKNNMRMDRLYDAIVRRDEHVKLDGRVVNLEREISEIKSKLAA